MKYITSDRYEAILTGIGFSIFFVIAILDITIPGLVNDNPHSVPEWWRNIGYVLSLWPISGVIFWVVVIRRGRKIMKTKEYQKALLKNNIVPEKKLNKEEEKDKYGL